MSYIPSAAALWGPVVTCRDNLESEKGQYRQQIICGKAWYPYLNVEWAKGEDGVDIIVVLGPAEMQAVRRGAVHALAAKATAGTASHRTVFFSDLFVPFEYLCKTFLLLQQFPLSM